MVDSPTASRGGRASGRIPQRSPQARAARRPRRRPNGAERTPETDLPEEAPGVRTLITRARSSLLTSFDTELEPFGVTGAQFEVLKNLARSDNETAASLCRALHYDTGSMTRMLDRLQEKRLVTRERDTSDRRLVFLRLTDTGESLIPKIRPALRRALRRHLAGLTPGEVSSLKRYLGRIIENGQRQ
ncbi:MAG TPA: MarR family transcriptional regulator [Steroidobacteraceae bacterium]|nr:MarR family transcriptional regulator [Steroidobacteraceae bacterium]